MKNRMMMLFAFLAAFVLSAPVLAAPPVEAAPAAEAAPAVDTDGADETAADTDGAVVADTDNAAPEPKAEEPKAEEPKTDEAPEPAVITTDEEAMNAVKLLMDAAKSGHWTLVLALSIMLLIYLGNRTGLLKKLPKKAQPWVAAGIGMGGYMAAALMTEGTSIMGALSGGIIAGASAVGLWEMVFKHLLAKKTEPAEAAAEEAAVEDVTAKEDVAEEKDAEG